MTVRSEGQFNTVVYEDYDLYRGQERRDVILMHPDDIQRLALRDDQPSHGAERGRAHLPISWSGPLTVLSQGTP